MDPLQLIFILILIALALTALVQWIGWTNYWKTRHAIRDELTAIAEDAERERLNNSKSIDGIQR